MGYPNNDIKQYIEENFENSDVLIDVFDGIEDKLKPLIDIINKDNGKIAEMVNDFIDNQYEDTKEMMDAYYDEFNFNKEYLEGFVRSTYGPEII